jgi:quinolinate synthase
LAIEAEIVVPGANSEAEIVVGVADHEGDGHRLAQRAAEAQHDAAHHPTRV